MKMFYVEFINGKAVLRDGRKITAKVYYRPEFFRGKTVSWDKKFPYSLELPMLGVSAGCTDLVDVERLLKQEYPDIECFKKTYDVYFNDDTDSNNAGFRMSLCEAIEYVDMNNGTCVSYFEDYSGGTAAVICNETGDLVYEVKLI